MKHLRLLSALILTLTASFCCKAAGQQHGKVIVAYVTSWSDVVPDPTAMTHINYAFGHVNDTFDGVRIDNPERLRTICDLRKINPDLKVMLSVGGWGSGRFSEMAADEKLRKKFADDCLRVVKEFKLDGIDIDWEYPGSDAAGISSSSDDVNNFSLLLKQLRETIGNHRLLTIATSAGGEYYDFRSLIPFVDFVNIMAYDMADAPLHHAPLYCSGNTGGMSCDNAVKAHINGGVPAGKLVLGVPFYGRGGKLMRGTDFKNIKEENGNRIVFDYIAKVPMLVNAGGEVLLGFDNPHSLNLKCDYILENGLLGAMYWDYDGDDSAASLQRTLAERLKNQSEKRKILVLNEGGGQHGPFTGRAMKWLKAYADTHNLIVTELRNANPLTEEFLNDYDLVIQLDFPPYTWPIQAESAFRNYIDNGHGSWIGFHHATLLGEFDGYGLWQWFSDFMGGITFRNYVAELADGTVEVENNSHPIMKGLPAKFVLPDDEWYIYDKSPRPEVEVLASVDENSYTPASEVKMGDHPVVWTNPKKKARNVYFQFGHSPKLFDTAEFPLLFANAINWALGND